MSKAIQTQNSKLCINALTETVTISFKASSGKINRLAGSWSTDGIVPGTVISTNSTAGNKGPFLAKTVTATDITIDQGSSSAAQGFATALVAKSSVSTILKAGLWVKELVSFSGFDGQASIIDVTSMDSTAKEKRKGIKDLGGFKGDFNYVGTDPGQVALVAALSLPDPQPFHFRFSNNELWEFSALALGQALSGGVDAKVDVNFTLTISGDVTRNVSFQTGT